MRYKEAGQVHMDFHRTTNGTITYLRKNYGQEFLDEVFKRTARDMYRSIREDLLRGDPEQLVEHWAYFFDREGSGMRKRHGARRYSTSTGCRPPLVPLTTRLGESVLTLEALSLATVVFR